MAQQQPARRKMQSAKTPVTIPDKLYFRIGDVARLCSLPAYVLRFWETEFPQLKPNKGGSGQRLYRKRDVEVVLAIQHLLYDEGFTIAGARRFLVEKRTTQPVVEQEAPAGPHPMRRKSDMANQPTPAKVGRSAGIAAVRSRPAPNDARFNELRKEMRDLLSMLGSEEKNVGPVVSHGTRGSHGSGASAPLPRKKKGRTQSDEPMLF